MNHQEPSCHRRVHRRKYRYKPGGRPQVIRFTFIGLYLCGLLFSSVSLYQYTARTIQTAQTNIEVAAAFHDGDAYLTTSPVHSPSPTKEQQQSSKGISITVMPPPPQATVAIFQHAQGEVLPQFTALLETNDDVIGWLQIADIIDLPVVYRDNHYYLTHDVKRRRSESGSLFLDEDHPLEVGAQHLVIHGHNMKDGSMFGCLQRYLQLPFYHNHGIIQFDSIYQEADYVVFAVLIISNDTHDENFVNYLGYPSFQQTGELMQYVDELRKRSAFQSDVSVEPGNALLTLSTCYGEERLVFVARRVCVGEDMIELKRLVDNAK